MTSQLSPAIRHRAGSAGRRSRPRSVALVVAAGLLAGLLPVWAASVVSASPTVSLVVNSTAWGGTDAVPGNGVCETAAGNGVCTLRAAIEESNALNRGVGEVEITVDPSIALNTKMTGTANASANRMLTSAVTADDSSGATFHVTAPVIIDLGHRLRPDGSSTDTNEQALFYLNGPDIQLLNADMAMSSGSSFVVGPNANRVTIDGDTGGGFGQIATPTYYPERFVVFREGTSNITVRNYQVTGYYDSATQGGLFVFNSQSPFTAMNNIVVDRVQALYSSGTTCSASNGTGCRTRLTNFWSGTSVAYAPGSTTINGLTFRNMLVQNMTTQVAFRFASSTSVSATVTDLVMEDNVFVNNRGSGTSSTTDAFLTLPTNNRLLGTTSIRNNVFSRASSGQYYAIYYYGNSSITSNNATASNVTIADNYFNNYANGATVRIERAGLVTMTGNTFGSGTGSQTGTSGLREEYNDTSVMFNTFHTGVTYSSNRSYRTWAPTAASTVLTGVTPEGALVMDSPAASDSGTCAATVDVARVTDTDNSSQAAGSPVTLQAYWTAANDAEVYLGEVTGVTGTSGTVLYQLPVGPVTLPDGTTTTAVNPTTGAASGYVRLQTHVEGLGQLASTQYSRFVSVTGTCSPTLTITQAEGQNDPTHGRFLHYTLTSSVPLDPETVTISDIDLAVVATADTIDAARINARVVSLVEVEGSGGMRWELVVSVDDSATVTASVAAGQVATPGGLVNQNPTSGTDASITFVNPLVASPASFTLVAGEEHGKDFRLSLVSGAPLPESDLQFTATVTQPADTPTVTLSTNSPVISGGSTSSSAVTVTAAAGDVAANTPTTVSFTVASGDPNYDGLVVPSVMPMLFSTDPTLAITKRAYIDMTDMSSAAGILATGTEAPVDSRLLDGQSVCWVYTVTNRSADDWATTLTDVVVTDSDTRLGSDGTIATIPVLGIGETSQVFACGALISADTTQG